MHEAPPCFADPESKIPTGYSLLHSFIISINIT